MKAITITRQSHAVKCFLSGKELTIPDLRNYLFSPAEKIGLKELSHEKTLDNSIRELASHKSLHGTSMGE